MICIQTGNALDVVYTYETDGPNTKLVGLRPHNTREIIPLPNSQGLIQILQDFLDEQVVIARGKGR